jgi:hypothetical protein
MRNSAPSVARFRVPIRIHSDRATKPITGRQIWSGIYASIRVRNRPLGFSQSSWQLGYRNWLAHQRP